MIGIVDYMGGNTQNVRNALRFLGNTPLLIRSYQDLVENRSSLDALILPGVGNFGTLMRDLDNKELREPLREWIIDDKPFLGICLGYQALFGKSSEAPEAQGLDIFKGEVKRFTTGKIPQIGWNTVNPTRDNIIEKSQYYFVNSFYPQVSDESIIAATTTYHTEFSSAIISNNCVAVQYHPEKSGDKGLAFLGRWLKC